MDKTALETILVLLLAIAIGPMAYGMGELVQRISGIPRPRTSSLGTVPRQQDTPVRDTASLIEDERRLEAQERWNRAAAKERLSALELRDVDELIGELKRRGGQ
jgi:hypothetical protein